MRQLRHHVARMTGALGDPQVPARTRHTAAARVLGLPVPTESVDAGPAVLPRGGAEVARPTPAPQDVSDLRRRCRRRRVARRTRTAAGVLAVAAGAVASVAWTDADLGRLAVSGGVMVVLILAWLVLRRVLR